MAVHPPSRLIVVEQRPHRRWLRVVLPLLWLGSLGLAWWLGAYLAAPDLNRLRAELSQSEQERERMGQHIERQDQQLAVLARSEQVERDAVRELQATLVEREAELAQLRNDVAFFERLAGGGEQRQPLAVHTLEFESLGEGGWRYQLTLTQSLKKAATSKGHFLLSIEGTQDGQLATLAWAELLQTPDAAGRAFSFKYFQQLEGSIVLPSGFIPHRVRVDIHSDQGRVEQTLPWTENDHSGAA